MNRLTVILLFISSIASAQEVLSIDEAVDLLLVNNYDVRIMNNNVLAAENNTSIMNSGYLPSVVASGVANYNLNNVDANFQNGTSSSLTGATSRNYSAGVNVNYVLFNGFGRKYNLQGLKEQYKLTDLQARETVELTLLQLYGAYYNVARLTENKKSAEVALSISKDRVIRAKYGKEYGKSSALDVLNAKVDLNADSISLISIDQELNNAKNDLNLLLARDIPLDFEVDTVLTFENTLLDDSLLASLESNNVRLLQEEQDNSINEYGLKTIKSNYLPVISLSGGYNWNQNFNNQASFLSSSRNNGLTGGVNLSWTLFDGGAAKVVVQNTKIAIDNQQIDQERTRQEVRRDFYNALQTYRNKKHIYVTQKRNLMTSKENFRRTAEFKKIGRVTSVEFRQAQLNLLQTSLSTTFSKYDAKLAEVQLLQISGMLLK